MWEEINNSLYKRFEFEDFANAFAFMTKVALLAESSNHHPKWMNEWDKVDIWLSTHDQGYTVTERDRQLAAAIDKIA
ncbi:4a-hydroxytetrahydrobiopterin dehydratase [Olivibacter sp. XZL3]|uniref:4a-hydroxytetrahydrobiopterin dehydratase n=1 Tax=Olivibacter sp. XZL3 TaxID=1735116 RepID=UPI0010657DE6|nr:4a-hydroxytetrahydrobiopterin dehydratase [Olivibacter sp. XZL3]